MKIVFFISLFFIVLLIILFMPVKTVLNLVFDSELGGVFYSLRMWILKLSSGKIEVENNQIVRNISTSKLLKLRTPKEQSFFFIRSLVRGLKLKNFYFVLKVPPGEDYFTQTLYLGIVSEVVCQFFNNLEKSAVNYVLSSKVDYDTNISNVVFETRFSINLFHVLYSLIYAKIKMLQTRKV